MAEFMREDRKDLVLAVFFEQRIEKDDALGLAEAGKIRISVT